MAVNVRPLHDRVLVSEIKVEGGGSGSGEVGEGMGGMY